MAEELFATFRVLEPSKPDPRYVSSGGSYVVIHRSCTLIWRKRRRDSSQLYSRCAHLVFFTQRPAPRPSALRYRKTRLCNSLFGRCIHVGSQTCGFLAQTTQRASSKKHLQGTERQHEGLVLCT